MPRPVSAGLLVFRRLGETIEFLLVHPGGPFWRTRDDGAWSIPKGLVDPDEEALSAAKREFFEETGLQVRGAFVELAPLRQPSGKLILAWAVEADLDLSGFVSNSFELEWPRGTGRMINVPEVDKAAYFPRALALRKILPGQAGLIEEVCQRVGRTDSWPR